MIAAVESDDLEEIRLAVVMNGGVSLAVWIAGVTNEVNRLARSTPDLVGPYGPLLNAVQATARVDVVSGASAGGINGAFLALATVYNTDLADLGELWARDAGFADLLRPATERDPPSILRGELFLERLESALAAVLPRDHEHVYRTPQDAPIHLTMTASLMQGEPLVFVDDYGTPMTQINHRGMFWFVRTERTPRDKDPFAKAGVVQKLALAARSTASFPGAFEPSFVPVSDRDSIDELHPDMSDIVRFGSSRYVLDGGILMNQPIGPALQAIADRPASRQVRRILAYVNPDPQPDVSGVPNANRERPPTLMEVLAKALVTLPAAQSVHTELHEIQSLNRRVREYRASQIDLIRVLGDQIEVLAGRLFDSYRAARKRRATRYIAEVVTEGLGTVDWSAGCPDGRPAATGKTGPAWTWDELLEAFDQAAFDSIPREPLDSGPAALDMGRWGISPVERISALAVDTLRRAIWLVPVDDTDLRKRLREQRQQLNDLVESARSFRRDDTSFWVSEADCGVPPPPVDSSERPATLRSWADEALRLWPIARKRRGARGPAQAPPQEQERDYLLNGLDHVTEQIIQLLVRGGPDLRQAVDAGKAYDLLDFAEDAATLGAVLDLLFGAGENTSDVVECRRRLLALEVCQVTLSGSPMTTEQEVRLIQVSASAESSFTGPTTAAQKLAGTQLGHFGAFYKESWRVNDWIWGRIDGATRMCAAVLGPGRLRQLKLTTDEALAQIHELAVGSAPEEDSRVLEEGFDAEACAGELAYLTEATRPVPPSLPTCALAFARRLHLEILREELPRLATAVRHDEQAGALQSGPGARFVTEYEQGARMPDGELEAAAAFSLFRRASIGRERIVDDYGSNMLAETLATVAAVSVGAVGATTSGLKQVQPIVRALRGITLALYALVVNAVSGSAFGVAVVNLALAVGAAALAVALLVKDAPPLIGAIGVTLLLAGLGLAALRARMPLYALIVGAIVVVVAAGAIWLGGDWRSVLRQLALIGIVGLVVLLAMLLGTVGTTKPKTNAPEPRPRDHGFDGPAPG